MSEHKTLLERGDLDGLQRLLTRQGYGTARVGRLFIPALGTELTLAADWTFRLFYENRNVALGKETDCTGVTLPTGTVLKVHRLYMRQGSKEFDSMSFSAKLPKAKRKPRFWAKLEDCHRMEFTPPAT